MLTGASFNKKTNSPLGSVYSSSTNTVARVQKHQPILHYILNIWVTLVVAMRRAFSTIVVLWLSNLHKYMFAPTIL